MYIFIALKLIFSGPKSGCKLRKSLKSFGRQSETKLYLFPPEGACYVTKLRIYAPLKLIIIYALVLQIRLNYPHITIIKGKMPHNYIN